MNLNIQTVDSTNTVTLTNKTLDKAVLLGVPVSAGQIGRSTSQLASTSFDNGMLGTMARVIAAGVGTQTFINNTINDQDFTTLLQFPANAIFTNKMFAVRFLLESITGVSTAIPNFYVKLGSTKIYASSGGDQNNSLTRAAILYWEIFGRDAAGASASVSCTGTTSTGGGTLGAQNTINQPVTGLATNGTLDLIVGMNWSATGSTESMELQGWVVEELN